MIQYRTILYLSSWQLLSDQRVSQCVENVYYDLSSSLLGYSDTFVLKLVKIIS